MNRENEPRLLTKVDLTVNKYPGGSKETLTSSSAYKARSRGVDYRLSAQFGVGIEHNNAIAFLLMFCVLLFVALVCLIIMFVQLRMDCSALERRFEASEIKSQKFECKLDRELDLGYGMSPCKGLGTAEPKEENVNAGDESHPSSYLANNNEEKGTEKRSPPEDDDDSMTSANRKKRDFGSKVDSAVNASLIVKSRAVESMRSRRLRGKILKIEKKFKALKERVASQMLLLKYECSRSVFRPLRSSEPRAAYLTLLKHELNIKKSDQVIGPWYLTKNGTEFGFNDNWFTNVRMNSEDNAVVFEESGMYIIYAQVYYSIYLKVPGVGDSLGFRINLKKARDYHRPLTLAECVAAPPPITTGYQSCFTQVAWFIEQGDEIFLDHAHTSRASIEGEKRGQTFLQIVKL